MTISNRLSAILLMAGLFLAARPSEAQNQIPAEDDPPPPGVEMLLPRGGIPAIFDPQFVPADQADLPDSVWVLGVEVNGEAHAYSLNLLNGHEVVNDEVGGKHIAAVW